MYTLTLAPLAALWEYLFGARPAFVLALLVWGGDLSMANTQGNQWPNGTKIAQNRSDRLEKSRDEACKCGGGVESS